MLSSKSSFISFLQHVSDFLSFALDLTNSSLFSSISAGLTPPSVQLTNKKEIERFFGTILIINNYRLPNYQLHFEEKSSFVVSPLPQVLSLERFQTLMTHFSFGSIRELFIHWENFLSYNREAIVDLTWSETLFLRQINLSPWLFTLLYDENGYLMDGVVEIMENNGVNFDRSIERLIRLFSNFREKKHRLVVDPECFLEIKVAENLGIMIAEESTNSKGKIKRNFGFNVLEELDFLDEEKKSKIKASFLLLEHMIVNYFLQNTQKEDFREYCDKLAKELSGIGQIEKEKEKEKKKTSDQSKNEKKNNHFPEKMTWCKKCKCCEEKKKKESKKINIKKTKYKCIQCSLENGRDVPLCLDGCFQEFHNSKN